MYLERIRRKHGEKEYISVLVRESYRDKGKVKHRNIANLSKLPGHVIQNIDSMLNNPSAKLFKQQSLEITNSREYGASAAFMELAKQLGLDKIIYSRKTPWRQDLLSMIVGRLLYRGSKLHLTQLHSDSALWELAGFKGLACPEAKHCYEALDRLLERQSSIQKSLAKRHLRNGAIVLYDITSSYLEGEYKQSELVDFGYSRDKKRGYEQIVIGLLANESGCPVAIEVFRGNTSDQSTVLAQAKKLANDYQVKDIVFVGDRGMLTQNRINEVNNLGYKTLTVLSRKQMSALVKNGIINPKQFGKGTPEVRDAAGTRYFLCKNPDKAEKSKETRDALIAKTKEELGAIKAGSEQQKCARVGRILAKYKVGKFFTWKIDKRLVFWLEKDQILAEESFDGCYVIRTDSSLSKKDAIKGYKDLTQIERAFRSLKSMSLEIRPIYHHLDRRIKAHVFLCMLAYYLEWHAIQRLKPLFAQDGKGSKRRFSFARVVERLKSIRIQNCSIGGVKLPGVITKPDNEQKRILALLKGSQKCEI